MNPFVVLPEERADAVATEEIRKHRPITFTSDEKSDGLRRCQQSSRWDYDNRNIHGISLQTVVRGQPVSYLPVLYLQFRQEAID